LDAILGNTVKVITLEEKEKIKEIKIPSGSQNGDCLIWRGYGCYVGMNEVSRGDFYI